VLNGPGQLLGFVQPLELLIDAGEIRGQLPGLLAGLPGFLDASLLFQRLGAGQQPFDFGLQAEQFLGQAASFLDGNRVAGADEHGPRLDGPSRQHRLPNFLGRYGFHAFLPIFSTRVKPDRL
jgi:hypothetical protein